MINIEKILDGKVAIITGTSVGIGAEILNISIKWCKVVSFVIKDKDMHRWERLDGLVQSIQDNGGEAISIIGM